MGAKKIERMTPEQEAELPRFRAKWLAIGSSTEPADRPRAEAAISTMYAMLNRPPPRFRWELSPFAAARYIRAGGGNPLEDGRFWGGHESAWIAFYLWGATIGATYTGADAVKLRLWSDVAQSCGWWWPYENECVISDRPDIVSWSDEPRPRIHSITGPAVRYRDGHELYAFRGTVIPGDWVRLRDTIDPAIILAHANADQRTAGLATIGWSRVLQSLKATVIDADADPTIGTLYRVDLPGEPDQRILQALCGTGRTIALRVPPTMKTAIEANAWTYGLRPDEYRPQART